MAYNPKNKKTFSLSDMLDGKNHKEVRWLVPRILKRLANNQVDLENEGFRFLDPNLNKIITDVTYQKANNYLWDLRAYDSLIYNIKNGFIFVDDQTYNKIIALRNEKNGKYQAYLIANDGFIAIRNTKSYQLLVELADKMKSYNEFY